MGLTYLASKRPKVEVVERKETDSESESATAEAQDDPGWVSSDSEAEEDEIVEDEEELILENDGDVDKLFDQLESEFAKALMNGLDRQAMAEKLKPRPSFYTKIGAQGRTTLYSRRKKLEETRVKWRAKGYPDIRTLLRPRTSRHPTPLPAMDSPGREPSEEADEIDGPCHQAECCSIASSTEMRVSVERMDAANCEALLAMSEKDPPSQNSDRELDMEVDSEGLEGGFEFDWDDAGGDIQQDGIGLHRDLLGGELK